jgi:hypothetical protein
LIGPWRGYHARLVPPSCAPSFASNLSPPGFSRRLRFSHGLEPVGCGTRTLSPERASARLLDGGIHPHESVDGHTAGYVRVDRRRGIPSARFIPSHDGWFRRETLALNGLRTLFRQCAQVWTDESRGSRSPAEARRIRAPFRLRRGRPDQRVRDQTESARPCNGRRQTISRAWQASASVPPAFTGCGYV